MAGDKEAALRLGEFELETTLAALNFFASFFYSNGRLPTLSSSRNDFTGNELHFCVKQGANEFGYHSTPKHREIFEPQIISKDKMVHAAFSKVSELLNDSGGKLGDRFLSAIKWAGKGAAAENRENAFAFYAIALEALLLDSNNREQLAYKMRLRAAHLFGLGLSDSERSKFRDRVNKLYTFRSDIVHSGKAKLSEADLIQIREITQTCIIRLLSDPIFKDISCENDLEKWFEDRMIFAPESKPS